MYFFKYLFVVFDAENIVQIFSIEKNVYCLYMFVWFLNIQFLFLFNITLPQVAGDKLNPLSGIWKNNFWIYDFLTFEVIFTSYYIVTSQESSVCFCNWLFLLLSPINYIVDNTQLPRQWGLQSLTIYSGFTPYFRYTFVPYL